MRITQRTKKKRFGGYQNDRIKKKGPLSKAPLLPSLGRREQKARTELSHPGESTNGTGLRMGAAADADNELDE